MEEVTKRIISFNQTLLQKQVQYKYECLTENIFRFYRGTNHLFYEDLHRNKTLIPKSPTVWTCGDLHIENFGSYKADNGIVYFDLNDFDEAILAPALWEVVRMVTSIFIAFNALDIELEKAKRMAKLFLKTYSDTLRSGKALYVEPQTAKGIVWSFLTVVSNRKHKDLITKKTMKKSGKLKLNIELEKHIELDKNLKEKLKTHFSEWLKVNDKTPYHYEVQDVVFRLAGTGSLGLKRYLFLLQSTTDNTKYLLLDMKQASPSSLCPYITFPQPSWKSEAARVVEIARRMQNKSGALLSTIIFEKESFVVEQMQPLSDKINFQLIKDRYRDVYQVLDDMAILTASAQLRSSGRNGSATADELIAFAKKDKWHEQVFNYCFSYSKRVKLDYKCFKAHYKNLKLLPAIRKNNF